MKRTASLEPPNVKLEEKIGNFYIKKLPYFERLKGWLVDVECSFCKNAVTGIQVMAILQGKRTSCGCKGRRSLCFKNIKRHKE